MQENPNKPRPGVGCPPRGGDDGVVYPEVLPAYHPDCDPQLRIGRVSLNRTTTLESPFFWMLLGGAAGAFAAYMILREKNRR